jgi:membrane fusion protein (multidrug efflux system)
MNIERHICRLLIAVGVVLSVGCGDDGPAGGGAGAFQRPPTPVETASVAREDVVDRFEAVGTIEAAEAITVVSEILGTIERLPFIEGSHVERGALLVKLDAAELAATLSRAEAIRDQRRIAYERVQVVVSQSAGTPQDLDNASAELKIAESDVALAKARLRKSAITAPFSGRVGARMVSPGAFVQPGTPITDLVAIGTINVIFTAPERFVSQLELGAEVQISTTAYPDVVLVGTIDVVNPVLDPATRSVEIIARADNPGERFRPGMSANVSAILAQRNDALTIPAEAVFAEGDQTLVYVVTPDSTVAKTPIALGLRLAGAVEVDAGLQADQEVVRAGHQKLFDGAKVMPIRSHPDGNSGESGSAASDVTESGP